MSQNFIKLTGFCFILLASSVVFAQSQQSCDKIFNLQRNKILTQSEVDQEAVTLTEKIQEIFVHEGSYSLAKIWVNDFFVKQNQQLKRDLDLSLDKYLKESAAFSIVEQTATINAGTGAIISKADQISKNLKRIDQSGFMGRLNKMLKSEESLKKQIEDVASEIQTCRLQAVECLVTVEKKLDGVKDHMRSLSDLNHKINNSVKVMERLVSYMQEQNVDPRLVEIVRQEVERERSILLSTQSTYLIHIAALDSYINGYLNAVEKHSMIDTSVLAVLKMQGVSASKLMTMESAKEHIKALTPDQLEEMKSPTIQSQSKKENKDQLSELRLLVKPKDTHSAIHKGVMNFLDKNKVLTDQVVYELIEVIIPKKLQWGVEGGGQAHKELYQRMHEKIAAQEWSIGTNESFYSQNLPLVEKVLLHKITRSGAISDKKWQSLAASIEKHIVGYHSIRNTSLKSAYLADLRTYFRFLFVEATKNRR